MGETMSFAGRHDTPVRNIANLIVELRHYRLQSEWLSFINELHSRLAGAIDTASMIEGFSVWLMPHVEHDLIAYHHPARAKTHLFCSSHGPERRKIKKTAAGLIARLHDLNDPAGRCRDGYFVRSWPLASQDGPAHLILLCKDRPIAYPDKLVDKALSILREALQRALNYEEVFAQARIDTLTGLANRRVFEERIGSMLDGAKRHGHPITLASLDLDNFKLVNDNFGHARGDIVLQEVAYALAGMIRGSDLLVRMGGDEFLLVLPETDLEAAKILGDRLCRAVDRLDIRIAGAAKLGISIGLAQWHPDQPLNDWVQRADEILYQAKSTGRSKVCAA